MIRGKIVFHQVGPSLECMHESNRKKKKRREGNTQHKKHIAAYDDLKKMAFFSRHGLKRCSYLSLFAHVRECRVGKSGITLSLSLSLSLFLFSLRHAVCFSLLSSPLQGHFLLCLLCFSVACLGSDSSFFLPLYFSWFFQNSKYSFGYSWLFFEMGFWVFFFASLMDFWSLWAQEIWEIVTFLVTVCGFFFLLSLNALLWDLVGYVHFRKHLCFLA